METGEYLMVIKIKENNNEESEGEGEKATSIYVCWKFVQHIYYLLFFAWLILSRARKRTARFPIKIGIVKTKHCNYLCLMLCILFLFRIYFVGVFSASLLSSVKTVQMLFQIQSYFLRCEFNTQSEIRISIDWFRKDSNKCDSTPGEKNMFIYLYWSVYSSRVEYKETSVLTKL